MRSIKKVQAGRGVSIIAEVNHAPMTVSVGSNNRLAHMFHFTLTDEEASISATAWDRVTEFGNFKLGEKVMVTNVTVKRVTVLRLNETPHLTAAADGGKISLK